MIWAEYIGLLHSRIGLKTVIMRAGVNRGGFNFKLAIVRTCSTFPLLNKYALLKKVLKWVFRPHRHLRSPIMPKWERQKIEKSWILFVSGSKCIKSNLKKELITFKKTLNAVYWPHGCGLSLKWAVLVKNSIFLTFGWCGERKTLQMFH